MLDVETRRRIDTARDILVGKVPDPKSQVEQITIALIYKFMWDIEARSEELGGQRSFFVDDFERFAWPKLLRSGLGGFETLSLYSEALDRIPENPGIPPLFRSIFNNAYLPYRDPETLREFLKVIDQFEYDHSERLGDAFEYLLSIMGAQGDAGQFRTPRHIIDFIVGIVNPQLYESVLDPACGTAGFLISAYKHIQRVNTDADGQSTLTPHERGRLAESFTGYDISPDMVRLSLVNMYLHGFVKPDIHEYDTLTSDERWDEYADVILANPPFMSPRGGIRPHNRFSVQSRRSEVLFVDYMAEHLTLDGRAGIIVPEGIIFQSQRAHTQLRKMLVEDYLVAVVSLPAGVFKPYSGVKTSVLILDRALARHANHIAFFKVENDGFDLGDQRRPIDQNDLPRTARALKEFLNLDGQDVQDADKASCPSLSALIDQGAVLIVEKERTAESGDYNLSTERYRAAGAIRTEWPLVRLDKVCRINPDKVNPVSAYPDQTVFYIDISSVENGTGRFLGYTEVLSSEAPKRARRGVCKGDILLSTVRPNLKAFTYLEAINERAVASTGFAVLRVIHSLADPTFVYALIRSDHAVTQMISMMGKGSYPSINQSDVASIMIPMPPLDVQREIVAEIESYQKVIDGARAVIDNYRPHIPIDPDWPLVALDNACDLIADGAHLSPQNAEDGERLYLTSKNVRENRLDLTDRRYISEEDHQHIYKRCPVRRGDVLYIKDGASTGFAAINNLDEEFSLLSSVAVLRGKANYLNNRFLAFFLNTIEGRRTMLPMMAGVAIRRLTLTKINRAEVPLPPYQIQEEIVAEIEAEQLLIDSNRRLIGRFEQKIETVIDSVWRGD